MLSKISHRKEKKNSMILHLYGIFKICVEFIEAESRMVATRGGEVEGNVEMLVKQNKVTIG